MHTPTPRRVSPSRPALAFRLALRAQRGRCLISGGSPTRRCSPIRAFRNTRLAQRGIGGRWSTGGRRPSWDSSLGPRRRTGPRTPVLRASCTVAVTQVKGAAGGNMAATAALLTTCTPCWHWRTGNRLRWLDFHRHRSCRVRHIARATVMSSTFTRRAMLCTGTQRAQPTAGLGTRGTGTSPPTCPHPSRGRRWG